jgi:mRNA interferase MazF
MVKGKVVLLPFPFDDFSSLKVRPAVCLTDPVGQHRQVVVAFITSKVPADLLDTDLLIPTDHPDFAGTGLRVTSTIRLHRLMTVDIAFIKRELGELSPALTNEVTVRPCRLFVL